MSVASAVFLVLLVLVSTRHAVAQQASCPCNTSEVWGALAALYEATNGPQWTVRTNWTVPWSSVCEWYGVSCSQSTMQVRLYDNRLGGTLPPSLADLGPMLTLLQVTHNQISGTLPPEYATLTNMTSFEVWGNRISGTLPKVYSAWTNLERFYIGINDISGTLPPEYSAWSRLITLAVEENRLSGSLPSSYVAWTGLAEFVCHSNLFSSTLPAEYSAWTHLERFYVGTNQISGTLPPEYFAWSRLITLAVEKNRLSGSLPSSYGEWTSLTEFVCDSNNFSSTLPAEYSAWAKLERFNVSTNGFSGTLPAGYGNWTLLETFEVFGNNLQASLAVEFGGWRKLRTFDAKENRLTGELPAAYTAWTGLRQFHVRDNFLSGTLPAEYSAWQHLGSLYVSSNNFSGTLPPEYSAWKETLLYFSAFENQFSGTLPQSYAQWSSILSFIVHNNNLDGTLPAAYSAWSRLYQFSVWRNQITSTLPAAYSRWGQAIKFLFFGHNRLSGTVPPSYSNFTNLQRLSLESNAFTGPVSHLFVRGTLGDVSSLLLLHNNWGLTGTLPAAMPFVAVVTVCNTSLCGRWPAAWALSIVVCDTVRSFSVEDMLRLQPTSSRPPLVCSSTRPPVVAESTVAPYITDTPTATTSTRMMSAVGSLSAATSVLGGSSGLALRRLTLTTACGVEPVKVLSEAVDFTNAPLQLTIGRPLGAWHRGAIVGSVVVLALAAVAGVAAVGAVVCSRRLRKKKPPTLRAAAAKLQLPGAIMNVVAVVYQQTVASSVLMLSELSTASDVCIALLGVAVCATCLSALAWRLVFSFLASASELPSSKRNAHGFRRYVALWALPSHKWTNVLPHSSRLSSTGGSFVAQYGLLFRGHKPAFQWWLLAEMLMTTVSASLTAVVPESDATCSAQRWLFAVLSAAWFGAGVVARPKQRRLSLCSYILSNGVAFVVALCVAAGVDKSDLGPLELFAACVGCLAAAAMALGKRYLKRIERSSDSTRTSPDTRSSSSKRSDRSASMLQVESRVLPCESVTSSFDCPIRQVRLPATQVEALEGLIQVVCNGKHIKTESQVIL